MRVEKRGEGGGVIAMSSDFHTSITRCPSDSREKSYPASILDQKGQ